MSRKILSVCCALIWSGTSASAFSEEPEVLWVTASRIPQPLHAIGSSVTVIDLDDWNGPRPMLLDVLRGIEGIHITQNGGYGQLTELRMRGGESNHTLVLLDGVEVNNPATGAVDFAHLSSIGIKRIEILRGAQSALWGSHAISGVINLISRDGGHTEVSLHAGTDRERQLATRLSHQVETTTVNLDWQDFRTQGDVIAPGGEEEDSYRNRTAHASVRWAPTTQLNTRFSVRHTQAHSEYDDYDFANKVAVDAAYHTETRRTLISAALDAQAFDLQHQWSLEYLQTHDQYHDNFPNTTTSQRTRARGLAWRVLEDCPLGPCTLGASAEWANERYTRNAVGPFDFSTASVLGFWKWQPASSLHWDLSLRRDYNQVFRDADTWRSSVVWLLPKQSLRLFAASGIAITNPTLIERFGYFPDLFIGNPHVEPERARTHEAGLEFTPAGWCCRISLHYFYQRLEDEIQTVFDPSTFTSTVVNRADRSHRRGIELEWSATVLPHWTVSGGYTWLRATEEDTGREVREARRPRHQYRLTLEYHDENWQARLHGYTVRDLRDFSQVLENYRQVTLSVRRILTPKLSAELKISNLLDEDWQEALGFEAPDRSIRLGLIWAL